MILVKMVMRCALSLLDKLLEAFPEMDQAFVKTFERWQEEILNYFDGRHTSGVVEGINTRHG